MKKRKKRTKIEYSVWILSRDKCPDQIYSKLRMGYDIGTVISCNSVSRTLNANNLHCISYRFYDYKYIGNIKVKNESSRDEILDELFRKFNLYKPLLYKGPSLSVGDVIELENGRYKGAYYVDDFGFVKEGGFFDEY